MHAVFDIQHMASHSLTGVQSAKGESKPVLDKAKVATIKGAHFLSCDGNAATYFIYFIHVIRSLFICVTAEEERLVAACQRQSFGELIQMAKICKFLASSSTYYRLALLTGVDSNNSA